METFDASPRTRVLKTLTTHPPLLVNDSMAGLVAYVSSDEEDENTRSENLGSRVRYYPLRHHEDRLS